MGVAFNGRVVFYTRHLSLGALERCNQFEMLAAKVDPDFVEKYPEKVETLNHVLAVTPRIDFVFQGDEYPMLTEFRDFWHGYQQATGEAAVTLALEWRKETHGLIIDAWVEEANITANPYPNPITAPYEALTPEQQAEADDPNSFLVSKERRTKKSA